MSIPKKHHYVSRCLIDNFFNASGKIYYYDKEKKNYCDSITSKNLFYEKGLNSKVNEEGQMSKIKILDLKRTRSHTENSNEDTSIYKMVQMTPELEQLLRDMGYEDKKGSDDYILAPEEEFSRSYMAKMISEAFNLLCLQIESTKEKKFKHLRKTYVTKCYISDEENFFKLTGHTNKQVPMKHYIDMDMVMEERRKKLYEQKRKES